MKKILLGLVLTAGLAGSARADELVVFNFNDGNVTGAASAANTANLFSVDRSNSNNTGSTLTTSFNAANIVSFGGTGNGTRGGDAAGAALALQGGTGAAGTTGGNNGGFLQFGASTVGNDSSVNRFLALSFVTQRSGTGFGSATAPNTLTYSTDGGTTFNTFSGNTYTPATSFAAPNGGIAFNFDLQDATLAALNNNANNIFRITFTGATSSSGNNRIDNLVLETSTAIVPAPVPEPTTIAMLLMGLSGVAGSKLKKKCRDSDDASGESANALEPLMA